MRIGPLWKKRYNSFCCPTLMIIIISQKNFHKSKEKWWYKMNDSGREKLHNGIGVVAITSA